MGERSRGAIGAVLAIAAAVIVALNPFLWWTLPVGALAALIVVRPKWIVSMPRPKWAESRSWVKWTVALLAFAAVVIGVWASVLLGGQRPGFITVADYRQIELEMTASHDSETDEWVVQREIRIPDDTLEATAEALHFAAREDRTPIDDGTELTTGEQYDLLDRELAIHGFTRGFLEDGEPVYVEQDPGRVPAHVSLYPLLTELTLPIPVIHLHSETLIILYAGEGSSVSVTGPENFIASSLPPGVASPVPGGELYKIPLDDLSRGQTHVKVEAVSPLVRYEPLVVLTKLSWGSLPSWVVVSLWGVGIGLMKDRIKKWLDALWARRRPAEARAEPATARRTDVVDGSEHREAVAQPDRDDIDDPDAARGEESP